MIPVLYDGGDIDPRRLGKGKLSDIISCVVHEELNGDFSMTLQYPITGVHYEEMAIGSSIVVVMPCFNEADYHRPIPVSSERGTKRDIQVFDIYKKSTPIDGIVTFYCQSIAWRLKDCVYYKNTWKGAASCKEILKDSVPVTVYSTYRIELNGAGFEVITPFTDAQTPTYTNSVPKSTLAMFLGEKESVVSTMGWDIAFTSRVNTSDPNTPALVSQIYALKYGRGEDYGVIIRHGYRLTSVEYTDDSTDTFNAVVPYWDDGNGNKTYVTGYVVQPTTPITPVKAVPMDCTQAFQTQPTGAQLAQYAQDWLDNNTPWVNVKNITLDFINGSEISGVNATINLGDTVRIYWPAADINIKLRAIAYDYDILAERYNSIELGKQQENFVSVTGIDGGSGGLSGGVVTSVNGQTGDVVIPITPTWYYEERSVSDTSEHIYNYTVNGDGWIIATIYIRTDTTRDYGSAIAGVYQTPISSGTEYSRGWAGTRTDTASTNEIGAEAVGTFIANSGDTVALLARCTKNGTKRIRYSIMCFGCTLTAQ